MLQYNDIMLLNDIIYKIHSIEDFDTMRKSVIESIQLLIPCKCGTFWLSSHDTAYELTDPIGVGVTDKELSVYNKEYQPFDYTRWTFDAPSGRVYRETDLLEESVRVNHPFYQKLFVPSGFHYSMMLTIIHNGVFLGIINLFRAKEENDFTDDEMILLELLESHLSLRCFKAAKVFSTSSNYPTKKNLVEEYNLTMREIEITYMLLDGTSREMICDQLSISANTLKKHILNIYRKLNINSWRELFQLLKE